MNRIIADIIGRHVFWILQHLPHFKGGEKIMWWILQNQSSDPNEDK